MMLETKAPDVPWAKVAEYIAMRCAESFDEWTVPFTPIGPLMYYSKKLNWNMHFLAILGATMTEWYTIDRWKNGNSIAQDGQVYASREAGVLALIGYIQDYINIEKAEFYLKAKEEYDLYMKWINDGEPFEVPVEPTYPDKPREPIPNPTTNPPKPSKPVPTGDWKKTLHAIATVLLSVWFLIDWFVPLPEQVKAGIKGLLTAIANMNF